ncbi:MAG: C25 family cysteine peptidase [Salinivenus sp.]
MPPVPSVRSLLLWTCLIVVCAGGCAPAHGQSYDPSWYDPEAPHVKIAVVEDGVYRVTGADLSSALPPNTTLDDIAPGTLRLLENGSEVPIQVTGVEDGSFDSDAAIQFVGTRNRGTDEDWAYDEPSDQSSDDHSLYSDTTYYWLTWGGAEGERYSTPSPAEDAPTTALRDTVHLEEENTYYFGRSFESDDPYYTRSEGYYWREFSHTSPDTISATYTLPVARRTPTSDTLNLSVRLGTQSNSCHRVEVEARLEQDGGDPAFETVASAEWEGYERKTLEGAVTQSRIPDDLDVRITSYNTDFSDPDCPDPASTSNFILLDYLEANYMRQLEARDDAQRFVAPSAGEATFSLTGHSSDTVQVYNASDGQRYAVASTADTASVSVNPSNPNTPVWAVGSDALKAPADILPDTPSNWSVSDAQGADYVILTTDALRPSATALADYRRTQQDYEVSVVNIQDVFDEFDYGRPTPIAIRRFVRALQDWSPQPQFLAIFADADYPVDTGTPDPRPDWSVPSFGFPPSDGWFAMQTDGPDDWSESLAIGRIPVRNNAQGDLFLDKLQTYEGTDPDAWQKRMLLLAGGTSESEQEALQFYSNQWGEQATGTPDTLYPAGMDTLRYYKRADDALDTSFQDSLATDLQRGAAWLSYFGHSAAQTWEIVTDPPEEFDNAGRLPIIVSLGCKTGSFAGARFGSNTRPSLGEQFVTGALNDDGTPVEGAENGGVAHWGTSALGNRLPSARLGDALNERVFLDTMRVLGTAIQEAKAEIADNFGQSNTYQRHLLTYGLLGDPATRIAMADRPDFQVTEDQMDVSPSAPTPSDLLSVDVTVQNFGLVPRDSVDFRLAWERPDGSESERTQKLPRFALETETESSFSLNEQALGTNTLRATVDGPDEYDEANELNNEATTETVVFDTGIDLIQPTDQGIARSRTPTLRASVLRQADESVPVRLQLDSVPDFNSPGRQQTRVDADSARLDWTPETPLEPGTSYYWRARLDDPDRPTNWKVSRFTVRPDADLDGWEQQGRLFTTNEQTRISPPPSGWSFNRFDRNVLAFSERGDGSRTDGFVVDGTQRYEYLTLGFGVLVVDGRSGRVKDSGSFATYDLPDNLAEREGGDLQEAVDSLSAFLDRTVETGDYVFARTRHLARQNGPEIQQEVKSLFQNLGSEPADGSYSTAIDTLSYRHLWTLKARYGHPDSTVERVSPPSEADEVNEITLTSEPSFRHAEGTTTTAPIGPVSTWDALEWESTFGDSGDSLRLDVLTPDSTVLVENLQGPTGEEDLSDIDAEQHPRLRLRATLTDSTRRTAPNLSRWTVRYTGVPELMIDPVGLQALPDTLLEGESSTVSVPVLNLGATASEPVRVRYERTGPSGTTTTLAVDTLDALPPLEDTTSTFTFSSSTDQSGANTLSATVESDGPPERIDYNNTALRNVYVLADESPPTLSVRSEGRELPETPEDIQALQDPRLPFVPTAPRLRVQVRDNNPYLRLTDTSNVEVYFKEGLPPSESDLVSQYRRVPFSAPSLSFEPAEDDGENQAQVLYEPDLPEDDGTYTLKIEASDAQGNDAEPHTVTFRVQQDQVIEDLYPYPNPMSDHTRFAFRVRGGNTRPSDFQLRIYTVSGRLVREFDGSEVNDGAGLRTTGWNFLSWNGRDEDGDRVATGVYLYRVRMDGEDGTFEGDVEKIAVIR